MATVTSGVGLISGIDYGTLVDQLMAIEAQPRDRLLKRISNLDAQRTAFLDISARLTSMLTQLGSLSQSTFFQATKATSSNADILSVTAGDGAKAGSYSFLVKALATAQQMVSRGYTSADASVAPGTITLESAQARVESDTDLAELNGFTGVQRGTFKIVDGSGKAATIDIRDALTVGDVIDKINAADTGVNATLRDEGIVLTDSSGGSSGIHVYEQGDGHTAGDLGFGSGHSSSTSTELQGGNVVYLADTTPLSALNDELGVRRGAGGNDFTIQSSDSSVKVTVDLSGIIKPTTSVSRLNHGSGVQLGTIRVTTRDGRKTDVDLSQAKTIGDVKTAIESAVGKVNVVMANGGLIITDSTGSTTSNLIIEDVQGHAARDLGILGSTADTKITGKQVLNVNTVGDVLAAINDGDGNRSDDGTPVIEASIDATGRHLVLTDHGGGAGNVVLAQVDGSTSKALADLGFQAGEYSSSTPITGGRIVGGIDTVLLKTLNGGKGIATGVIHVNANGTGADIDLTGTETLRDVIDRINAASQQANLGIAAGYDSTGARLLITNTNDGSGTITISDVSGSFAQSAGIAGSAAKLRSGNLQRQYVSELTQLGDLNLGRGVSLGQFQITNSVGVSRVVDLAADGAETLQDVIDAVKKLNIGVEARINDTGDGLLLVDTAGGAGTLKVAEQGGTTAHDLNLLQDAVDGQIDGSYETHITTTGESLSNLVDQINGTTLASASLVNDGSSSAPYRLSITSRATGLAGELMLDAGDTDLDLTTLARAQDARVVLGGTDGQGLLVTSSSNTLTNIAPGLTVNLTGVSDTPITVTVATDVDSMTKTLQGLVDGYNNLMSRIDDIGGYNADTQTAGILLGDSTLQMIQDRVARAFSGSVPGATGAFTRLSQIGISFGTDGTLTFDEDKFREVYQSNPDGVTQFFTTAETGVAVQLKDGIQKITDTDGLIDRTDTALEDQKNTLTDRVSELNDLLAAKRQRLLAQFQAMEQTLASLQSQQSALSNFSSSLSSLYSSSSSSS